MPEEISGLSQAEAVQAHLVAAEQAEQMGDFARALQSYADALLEKHGVSMEPGIAQPLYTDMVDTDMVAEVTMPTLIGRVSCQRQHRQACAS